MIITSVKTHRIESLLSRTIETSLGNVGPIHGVAIQIIAEKGLIGLGWATENAFYAGETLKGMESAIEDVIAPIICGKSIYDIESIMVGIEKSLYSNYRIKSAVDMALHDLIGQALEIPVYQYLGGLTRPSIASIRLIGVNTPNNMVEEALELQNQGYHHFKLKLDGQPQDIDRVKAVCETLNSDTSIILDPNQGYTPKGAIQFMNQLHMFSNITILEQPVPVHDLKGMALVRNSVDVLIEADESVRTMYDAYRIIEYEAADILSLKVSKMGGIHWVRKIADLCEGAGIPCLIGADVGLCVHDLAQLHIAVSHSNIQYTGCEIGESTRLLNDPTKGLDVRNGILYPPKEPGLGSFQRILK